MGSLHSFRQFVGDSLSNLVSGLGTSKDAYSHTRYNYSVLDRSQLEAAYRSNWLARAIVDAPAEDATREWREWQTDQDNIEKLEAAEKQFDLQRKLKRALILARLYGGAAIVMGVNQGKAEEELDIERVKGDSLRFIEVFHQYELSPGQLIRDIESPWFNRPEYYQLGSEIENVNKKQIASVMIHPSRVISIAGHELPDLRSVGSHVWGDSVLQVVDDAVKATGTVIQGIATMIADAKMDVVKIPGLSKHLASDEFSNKLVDRFMTANQMKSMVNTLLLDEKEEWQRVQTNFGSLPNLIQEYLTVAAGAAGIPVSRLLGGARGKGLSGSEGGGETDTRTYYDHISDMQRNELSPTLTPLDEIFIRSVLGKEDESIYYEWSPLWQLSDNEKADIANKKAVTTQADVTMALINPDVLREIRINQLIEDATYPGIEDAVEEFGSEPEEPPVPSPEDMQNHIGMMQKSAGTLSQLGKHAINSDPRLQKQLAPPQKAKPKDAAFVEDRNDNRHPAGTPGGKGGEYAPKEGGGGDKDEDKRKKPSQYRGKFQLANGEHAPATKSPFAFQEDETSASSLLEIEDVSVDDLHAKVPGSAEQDIEARRKLLDEPDTEKLYKLPNGNYAPERQALHHRIVDRLMTPEMIAAARPAPGEPPTLFILGGRGGSGKGWYTNKKRGGTLSDVAAVYINNDDVKEALPEYEGWNAGKVHEEASHIAEGMETFARDQRLNIIVDATLKSEGSLAKRIKAYKAAGYRISGHYMYASPATAAERALGRFVDGNAENNKGRFVPPEYSLGSTTNEDTFDKHRSQMDYWEVYDNMGEWPALPKLHSRKGG